MTLTVRPFGAAMRTFLLLLGLFFIAQSANAACSNPTGNAGDMTYSTSANVMVYCDSSNWISMAGGVSLTVNTSGGGTATPAGSAKDVQFNDGTNLAADTGNFTYSSGLLKAPNISTTAITASGAGTFGTINSSGLGTLGSLIVTGGATITGQASITLISTSLIQVGNNGASCTSGLAGGIRYSTTSNTIDYCSGSGWVSLGPSATVVPSFAVYGNSTQSVANSTYTKLTVFGSVTFDTNANFSANRYTVSIPGTYIFTAGVRFPVSTGNTYIYITKNGSILSVNQTTASGSTWSVDTTAVDRAVTGDYYEVYVQQTSGGALTIPTGSYTYFSGSLLTMNGGGSGGTANPAGGTNDIQFNSGGLLAADTGNFTYTSSTLKTPSLLTGGITATGQASLTTVSTTLLQMISNTATACTSNLAGAQRYNSTSNTIDYCSGSAWLSLGPSATVVPAFAVNKGGTNQTVTTGQNTKLTWNTVEYDTNNNFSTGTGRYTPTVPGKYIFNASCGANTASSSNAVVASIIKNGTISRGGDVARSPAAGATNLGSNATAILDMNGTTDYVEAYCYLDGTTILGTVGVSYFQGILVSMAGGGGGTATPAGSTNDVQFNSGGLLAADTGNFTYTSSTLKTPSLLTGGITATGQASLTTVSSTLLQLISNTTTACTAGLAGAQRYNDVSNSIDYCTGTAWMSMGPSATTPVAFQVSKNADQTVTASQHTKLTWQTEEFDTNNNFAANRFTATIPGFYLINLNVFCTTNIANGSCQAEIWKNGSAVKYGVGRADSAGAGGVANAILYLGVGDYVEGYAFDDGVTIQSSGGQKTYMSGVLLSPQGGGSGGTGVSAMPSLTDVALTNLAGRDYLRYDAGTSKWVNISESTAMNTTTMVNGWPDAIVCTTGSTVQYLVMVSTDGVKRYYAAYNGAATIYFVAFANATGAYSTQQNMASSDCVTGAYSISQLYAQGKAFNFIGSANTSSSTALGDRITSGTLSIIANTGTAYASLTTNGINWGYLSSGASFIPQLQVNGFDAGNVSASLIQVGANSATCNSGMYGGIRWNATSDTIQVCNTAGWISVASSSVPNVTTSAGTANYGAIFSGPNTLVTDSALYIDRTNHRLGIGTATPQASLDVVGTASATTLNSQYLSATTVYNPGSFSGNTVAANSVSSTRVSSTNISGTLIQVGNNGASCASGLTGAMRYTSGTMQVCDGSGWTNIGLSVPQGTITAFALTSCPSGWSEYTPARGRFLRGIDNGAGLDPSGTRVPGSQQSDAIRNITGSLGGVGGLTGKAYPWGFDVGTHGAISVALAATAYNTTSGNYTVPGGYGTTANFDASDVVPTSTENRPVNVAVIFCQYDGYAGDLTGNVSATSITASNITTTGNLLVGLSTPYNDGSIGTPPLQTLATTGARYGMVVKVASGSGSTGMIGFANSNGTVGTITTNGTATAFSTSSDRRLKENIVDSREGLQKLMQIRVTDFNFRKDPGKTVVQGFIAQDLDKVYPEAVVAGDNDVVVKKAWSVDYGRVTPLIVKAVQDIASLSETFRHTLVEWFASAGNGIHDLFVGHVHADDVHATTRICVGETDGETCLTQNQVEKLLKVQAANDNLARRLEALEKRAAR